MPQLFRQDIWEMRQEMPENVAFWHISGYLFMASSTRESVSYALLLLLFLPGEEPMNTILISEMSVASKWHLSQRVEQAGVCSLGKLREKSSEFRSGGLAQVQADGIAWFWGSGGRDLLI
jgi:hypothetical protein